MKLLTHNLLSSHVRGVGPQGFPLRIQATEVRVSPVDFNPDFVTRMIPKMEWTALVDAAESVSALARPLPPPPVSSSVTGDPAPLRPGFVRQRREARACTGLCRLTSRGLLGRESWGTCPSCPGSWPKATRRTRTS
ncbi:multifunctional methyltransferase subunit TRM112-like protein isoform X1 [Notamacropus eugenii]|uniref:multifunctional methyltransferase subunit TRM112-like protein isoform X1 n=1 Tax=Notamacropus eugenii TaxID=9315 RepID=UPI003B680187